MRTLRRITALLILLLATAAQAEAPRAYRNFNFGDSPETVAQKTFDDDLIAGMEGFEDTDTLLDYQWMVHIPLSLRSRVGPEEYYFIPKFQDDHLYSISFISELLNASWFDTTVMNAQDNLVEVITQARGPADETWNISFLDVGNNVVSWSHIWQATEEGVTYKIGLSQLDAQYYAELRIEWYPLATSVPQEEDETRQSQQRDAAEDY